MATPGCCGGCFGGLGSGRGLKPDVPFASPSTRTAAMTIGKVATLQEALVLQRPDAGSWLPSPPRSGQGSPGDKSAPWASPIPHRTISNVNSEGAGAIELEWYIEDGINGKAAEARAAEARGLAGQLDTDVPAARRPPAVLARPRERSKFEAEQLLASPGSLPKPMSHDEREAAIRSLLPTATFQMLAKVPPELLRTKGEEGQVLRRRLAAGATVVFISAGLPCKRFTFERAAALGIKVVIIEHPDSWSSSLVQEGLVAKFLPVDLSQGSDAVFAQALALIKTLGQDGATGAADGIATFVELSVPLVARLCEGLGLPGHRPSAVDAARNKHATRAGLKAAGLSTPRNYLIRKQDEVMAAGAHVGFPAVLKPVCGAASLGVKKVTDSKELMEYYNEIVAELKTLVVTSGALVKGGANSGGVYASSVIDLTMFLEQYLDGCEVDVDVVMSEGEWRYAAVADNGPTMEPYFNETWAVCPSLLPKDQQAALKELAVKSVKAIGFTSGVFHVECKYTSTGPQLIEVNARMGGGQVHECNFRTWGVDLVEETLFAALGIPARPAVPTTPLSAVAYCYVNAAVSGRVRDMSGLETLRGRGGVVWAKPLVEVGTEVVGPERGLPTWLCDLLVTRPSPKQALDLLFAVQEERPVRIE